MGLCHIWISAVAWPAVGRGSRLGFSRIADAKADCGVQGIYDRVTINMYQRNGEQQDWAGRWQTWKAQLCCTVQGQVGCWAHTALPGSIPAYRWPQRVWPQSGQLSAAKPTLQQLEANLSVRHFLTVLSDHNCFWSPVFIGVDKMAHINDH